MKDGMTTSVSICLIAAAVLGKLVASAQDTHAGQRPADGNRAQVLSAPAPRPSNPAPTTDQRSLAGFVAAWSGSSSLTKEALAKRERAEALAAHEREVAMVSRRMLQIQARQDPGRAEFYLRQINDKASAPGNAVSSVQYRQATDRQQQTNEYMSAKLDRLRAAQRR
jgi:hypothetical protein